MQQKYFIVGSTTYSLTDTSQLIHEENGKVLINLVSPKSQIAVNSGDIVGLFIRGSGVRIKYLTNLNIHTYVVTDTSTPLEAFSAEIIHMQPYLPVAPLIRATVEGNGKFSHSYIELFDL